MGEGCHAPVLGRVDRSGLLKADLEVDHITGYFQRTKNPTSLACNMLEGLCTSTGVVAIRSEDGRAGCHALDCVQALGSWLSVLSEEGRGGCRAFLAYVSYNIYS
jgi:hypothetical protein